MKRGRLGTMTHDHKRNGTTTLFAALNVLDGTVIGLNMQRHRHQEFIRFLNAIGAEVPADKAVTACHPRQLRRPQAPKSQRKCWLNRHKRFNFHFTATSPSWLKRGAFHSVVDLQAAINRSSSPKPTSRGAPKPFQWTANPDTAADVQSRRRSRAAGDLVRSVSLSREIIAAVKRKRHQVLDSIH